MDLHSTHIPCDTHINFEQLRIKLENEDTVCEVVENAVFLYQMENRIAISDVYHLLLEEVAGFFVYALRFAKKHDKINLGWNVIQPSYNYFVHWKEGVDKVFAENSISVNSCGLNICLPTTISKGKFRKKLKATVISIKTFENLVKSSHAISCKETALRVTSQTEYLINLLESKLEDVSNLDNEANKEIQPSEINRSPGLNVVSTAIVDAFPETNTFF